MKEEEVFDDDIIKDSYVHGLYENSLYLEIINDENIAPKICCICKKWICGECYEYFEGNYQVVICKECNV